MNSALPCVYLAPLFFFKKNIKLSFFCYETSITEIIFYYYEMLILEVIFYCYRTPIFEGNFFFTVMKHYSGSYFFTIMEHIFQKEKIFFFVMNTYFRK